MLKNHPRLQFHILADGHGDNFRRALPSFIEINTVPESFQPQKATYKARALEYFRLEQNLSKDDWVLHLDEESEIDEFVIKTCLDFIERGDDDIGMVCTVPSSLTILNMSTIVARGLFTIIVPITGKVHFYPWLK